MASSEQAPIFSDLSSRLTAQQAAVVAHDDGPALVFAVAGAGKTTAMVHRIARLVREKRATPREILATTFAVSNVRDLREALSPWPACRAVDVRTLHSLGRQLIRLAQRQGYLQELKLNGEGREWSPLYAAQAAARQRALPFVDELDGLDQQDFLDYVGSCKGNLQYADLAAADLPPAGRALATQAAAPSPVLAWYVDLYRLYEEQRLAAGIVTYDDMLMTGWEVLVRYPEILAKAQGRYRHILVDEFQDINLAQYAILEQLSAAHRQLMVIGDDDQTIYEWRGARSAFILSFAERFQAAVYTIDDNFRSTAGPLLLANQVIAHNRARRPKRLQLTRGLGGETTIRAAADINQLAADIVGRIERLRDSGLSLDQIAVLVRLNGQTPPLEQVLISRGIPYRVSQPFYERPEIVTLIDYARLAWLEQHVKSGGVISEGMRRQAESSWRSVANRPKRYISNKLLADVGRRLRRLDEKPSRLLHRVAAGLREAWLQDRLLEVAEEISWLSGQLDERGSKVLRQLDGRLGYRDFLRDSSGFSQTGEGRAAGVDAFIHFARGQGSLLDLMQELRRLAAERQVGEDPEEPAVVLSTIHRAKGLEWEAVFVPQLNDGLLPFRGDGFERQPDEEEERRLFYVALTRAKRELHVSYTRDQPPSPFLGESGWKEGLGRLDRLRALLAVGPAGWTAGEVVDLVQLVRSLHLERWLREWWDEPKERRREAAHAVQRLAYAAAGYIGTPKLPIVWDDIAVWEEIDPLPAAAAEQAEQSRDFPGLAAYLAAKS